MSAKEKYLPILRSANGIDLYSPALEMLELHSNMVGQELIIQNTTALVTGPTLLCYVLWLLGQAQSQQIETLYFLSRDGYVPLKIAQILCNAWGLPIQCKYLYCSRRVLRLPLYAADRDYFMRKLMDCSAFLNIVEILEQAGIGSSEALELSRELGLDPDARIHPAEMDALRKLLDTSEKFHTLALPASQSALEITGRYFEQECVGKTSFALVDVGWMGSMQEGFQRIWNHYTGQPNPMTGFYFGLTREKKEARNAFHAFYFSPHYHWRRFISFSINLLECLCSADHGMTIGYALQDEKVVPVMKSFETRWPVDLQIETCIAYTKAFLVHNSAEILQADRLDRTVYGLLKRFMHTPSLEEAEVYGSFPFSDNPLESRVQTLVTPITPAQYKLETFTGRVKAKLRLTHPDTSSTEWPFWSQGAIVVSGRKRSAFNRLNEWILKEYLTAKVYRQRKNN
ncbi:hypothetical protein LJC74_06965 [Eubacteriales bacterium OttesenSCG-928-A19]|nr:hypothetical protein [Eubacteriales bacterium OttesenSCG-928-A19]